MRVRKGIVWNVSKLINQATIFKKWIESIGERTRLVNPIIGLLSEILVWKSDSEIRVINEEAENLANVVKKLLDFEIEQKKAKKLIQIFGDLFADRKDNETDDKVFVENVLKDMGRIIKKDEGFNYFIRLSLKQRKAL